MKKVDILGVQIDAVTSSQAVAWVEKLVRSGGKGYVVTPNPEFVVAAQSDDELKEALNQADLAIPDGVGLRMAAKFLSWQRGRGVAAVVRSVIDGFRVGWWGVVSPNRLDILPERVSGVGLVSRLLGEAAQHGYTIFLLGKEWFIPEKQRVLLDSEAVRSSLEEQYPGVRVVGTADVSPDDDAVTDEINQVRPNLLLVSFGCPDQEKWISRNLPRLEVNAALGIGGSLDFIVGAQRRAPGVWQRWGVEWLWRLVTRPNRWRRIWTAFPVFPWRVFRYKFYKDYKSY